MTNYTETKNLYYWKNGSTKKGTLVDVLIGSDTRSLNTNPEYKRQIARKQDATTAYSNKYRKIGLKQISLPSSVIQLSDMTIHTDTCYSSAFDLPGAALTSHGDADDAAIKRLKRRIDGSVEQFKALVPLGEIKETRRIHHTMREMTENMLKTLISLKRGRVRDAFSKASKSWLAFSFGISPLVADFENGLHSIASYLLREDFTSNFYGTGEASWTDSVSGGASVTGRGLTWSSPSIIRYHHYQVRYTAGINFMLKSSNNYGAVDHFGLEFKELIPTAWELVPFSWVVDYFTTTGDFLSDTFSSDAGNTIYVSKSIKYSVLGEKLLKPTAAPGWQLLDTTQHWQQGDVQHFARIPYGNTIPHRSLRFKTADEIGVNSVKRLLNLASVLLS